MIQGKTFREFMKSLDGADLEAYAEGCGTSPAYLYQLLYRYRIPRPQLMTALVANSNGQLTRDAVLEHFYPQNNMESVSA